MSRAVRYVKKFKNTIISYYIAQSLNLYIYIFIFNHQLHGKHGWTENAVREKEGLKKNNSRKMQDWKMEEQIWGQARRWKMRERKMEDQKMEDRKSQDQVLERKMHDKCR